MRSKQGRDQGGRSLQPLPSLEQPFQGHWDSGVIFAPCVSRPDSKLRTLLLLLLLPPLRTFVSG